MLHYYFLFIKYDLHQFSTIPTIPKQSFLMLERQAFTDALLRDLQRNMTLENAVPEHFNIKYPYELFP